MKITLAINFCILLLSSSISSQSFFEEVLNKHWEGEGEIINIPAQFNMNWNQVLDNQFYILTFQNSRKTNDIENVFQAIGYYKIENEHLVNGYWLDNLGNMYLLKGEVTSKKMTIYWGSEEINVGKTIYEIKENGKIEVIDFTIRDKKEIIFATAQYTPSSKF